MEKEITSKNNALIKDLSKLSLKKYRNETGFVLVEGERLIKDLMQRNVKFEYLLYEQFPSFANNLKCEKIKCSQEVLKHLAQTVTSSNIFAVVNIKKAKFQLPNSNFLILDKVSDPGNLGTIIRTALAFNFKNIYLYNCVDWTNDKVLRASMGTIADINLFECDLDDLNKLKSYNIYCADMKGENLEKINKSKDYLGVILGNEANGVSDEIYALAKNIVSIPMQNSVESLNVAVAGAIIMNKLC